MIRANAVPTESPKTAEVAIPQRSSPAAASRRAPAGSRGRPLIGLLGGLSLEAAALWQLVQAGLHPAVAAGVAYGVGTALRQAVAPKRMPGFSGRQQTLLSGGMALLNSACVAMVLSLAAWPVWLAWGLSRSAIWFGWNAPLQRFLAHIHDQAR